MKNWERAGLHPSDFWSSTPKQIIASLRAREVCLVRESNGRITEAYYTAALVRWNTKKKPYPKLDSLLHDGGARRVPTVEEQWLRMKSIAATRRTLN